MCGIACLVRHNELIQENEIKQLISTLEHRGPDHQSVFIDNSVGLGHARLSIIDLELGNQPMFSDDKRYSIIYNGELYNYRELRKELSGEAVFHTNSDTEVILKAFIARGSAIFNSFRGMFAFSIYDSREQKITFCRDQMGIKPLYYYHHKDVFVVASELQAIKSVSGFDPKLNLRAIDQYLCLQYIPAPDTIYEYVHKLEKGQFLEYDIKENRIKISDYYSVPSGAGNTTGHDLNSLNDVLKNSVEKHLVSDVPFGAFLSGGIDSTLVVSYMSQVMKERVKTFSISFDDQSYDESEFAKHVASKLGTEHHNIPVKADALSILPELVRHYGEPFGDSSSVPTYYVCKAASDHVKMVLSGDGGDEMFAGYETYSEWNRRSSYHGLNTITAMKYRLRNLIFNKKIEFGKNFETWIDIINYFNLYWRERIWQENVFAESSAIQDSLRDDFNELDSGDDQIRHVQLFDIRYYLPNDILTKVDVASMMSSLEVRTPFVDHKVMEYALSMSSTLNFNKELMDGPNGKLMLKQLIAQQYGDKFAYRKKMGFATPLKKWLCTDGVISDNIRDRLTSETSGLNQIFRTEAIESLIRKKRFGPIWLLLVLDEWFSQNKYTI